MIVAEMLRPRPDSAMTLFAALFGSRMMEYEIREIVYKTYDSMTIEKARDFLRRRRACNKFNINTKESVVGACVNMTMSEFKNRNMHKVCGYLDY